MNGQFEHNVNPENVLARVEKLVPQTAVERGNKETLARVNELERLMQEKSKELSPNDAEAKPDALEHDLIRKRMLEAGDPAKEDAVQTEEKELDEEELEREAVRFIKDCESGWTKASAFHKRFREEIDRFKLGRLSQRIGHEIPMESQGGFHQLGNEIRNSKRETFQHLLDYSDELPDNLSSIKEKFSKEKDTENVEEEFNKVMTDETVVPDLDNSLFEFRERYELKRPPEITDAVKTLNRADILGIGDGGDIINMRKNLEGVWDAVPQIPNIKETP